MLIDDYDMRPSATVTAAVSDPELHALYIAMEMDPAAPPPDEEMIQRMHEICAQRDQLKHRCEMLERDTIRLASFLDRLQFQILAIESSRAWKIGYGLMRTARSVLGRSAGHPAFAEIHRLFTLYHHWKKAQ